MQIRQCAQRLKQDARKGLPAVHRRGSRACRSAGKSSSGDSSDVSKWLRAAPVRPRRRAPARDRERERGGGGGGGGGAGRGGGGGGRRGGKGGGGGGGGGNAERATSGLCTDVYGKAFGCMKMRVTHEQSAATTLAKDLKKQKEMKPHRAVCGVGGDKSPRCARWWAAGAPRGGLAAGTAATTTATAATATATAAPAAPVPRKPKR